MINVAVIGASGHAKSVINVIHQEGKLNIWGIVDPSYRPGDLIMGHPVIGGDEDLLRLKDLNQLDGVVIGIGDNSLREKIVNNLKNNWPGIIFYSSVHPSASIGSDVRIGVGTVVMAGVCINSCSKVGDFCILNTSSLLEHDSSMGDFSSLAPGAITGGNCHIMDYSAIGIGATLLNGISIGEHSVIGAGSIVNKSVNGYVVAYGSPAKVIRARKAGDKYM